MTRTPTFDVGVDITPETHDASDASDATGTADFRIPVVVLAETPVMAHGLAALLDEFEHVRVVGTTTEPAALTRLIVERGARMAVAELQNAHWAQSGAVLEHVSEAARIRGVDVATVCIIPSSNAVASRLRRSGASVVVTLSDAPDVLQEAIRVANADSAPRRLTGPAIPEPQRNETPSYGLTPRELDVLQGMVDGFSSKVIADRLGLSTNTVRTHVQRLLPKLGAHNRLRATALAVEAGLVSPTVRRLDPAWAP